jgi:hypothetical protein
MNRMKNIPSIFWILFLVLLALECASPKSALAHEITLFDPKGDPIAYIDIADEHTIYLWSGDPVAYLDGISIYGYNGKHLGWFKDGIVLDHDGYGMGFAEGAVSYVVTKFEPFKNVKKFQPFRSLQELEPSEPFFNNEFSPIPLEKFLEMGK